MEPQIPEFSWQIIAGLITFFGSLIALLLTLIGFFARRYVAQTDVRLKDNEKDIGELRVITTKHSTEIKNIHHRIKEF